MRTLYGLLLLCALFVAGCAPEADVDTDADGSFSVESDDGSVEGKVTDDGSSYTAVDEEGNETSIAIGNGLDMTLFEGIEYPGWTIDDSRSAAMDSAETRVDSLTFSTDDSPEEVAAFYEEKWPGSNRYVGTEASNVHYEEDGVVWSATAFIDDGRTLVTLTRTYTK